MSEKNPDSEMYSNALKPLADAINKFLVSAEQANNVFKRLAWIVSEEAEFERWKFAQIETEFLIDEARGFKGDR